MILYLTIVTLHKKTLYRKRLALYFSRHFLKR